MGGGRGGGGRVPQGGRSGAADDRCSLSHTVGRAARCACVPVGKRRPPPQNPHTHTSCLPTVSPPPGMHACARSKVRKAGWQLTFAMAASAASTMALTLDSSFSLWRLSTALVREAALWAGGRGHGRRGVGVAVGRQWRAGGKRDGKGQWTGCRQGHAQHRRGRDAAIGAAMTHAHAHAHASTCARARPPGRP